jgi:hypothetical protein
MFGFDPQIQGECTSNLWEHSVVGQFLFFLSRRYQKITPAGYTLGALFGVKKGDSCSDTPIPRTWPNSQIRFDPQSRL